MKKIAIITPVFPPYRGGMGTVAELDAVQLAKLGYEVRVYTPSDSGLCAVGGYCIEPLKSLFRFGNAAFVPAAAKIWDWCDVAVLHYPFFGGAEPFLFARRRRSDQRLIVVYHMDVVGKGWLGIVFRLHARWLMPRLLRKADRVLVTSKDYAEHGLLKNAGLDQEKWRELPPSVDTAQFAPGPSSARARFGFTSEDKVIGFVGGLDSAHYFKGVPVLLEALAHPALARAKAIIVGDGDLRAGFEKKASELGVSGRVRFAGGADPAALADIYRAFDVLAFPSLDASEAFGIVALEAEACGVPVVASALPGVRTVVRHGRTGYTVPPGSVDSLAMSLAKVLDDPEARRMLSENARHVASAEYGLSVRSDRWKKILDELP